MDNLDWDKLRYASKELIKEFDFDHTLNLVNLLIQYLATHPDTDERRAARLWYLQDIMLCKIPLPCDQPPQEPTSADDKPKAKKQQKLTLHSQPPQELGEDCELLPTPELERLSGKKGSRLSALAADRIGYSNGIKFVASDRFDYSSGKRTRLWWVRTTAKPKSESNGHSKELVVTNS